MLDMEGEGTAVVLGAGIAGLLAAHVACKHFQRVLLIERDNMEIGEVPVGEATLQPGKKRLAQRPGVLQFCHPHLLMPGGLHAFEKLLPGFGKQLAQHGGVILDCGQSYIFDLGLLKFREASNLQVVTSSRGLLERVLRARVAADSGGRLVQRGGVRAEGLFWSEDGMAVVGVRVAGGEAIPAALVIDAMGRYSRLPLWLEEGGWGRPKLRTVDSKLCYTSCTVLLPQGWSSREGAQASAAAAAEQQPSSAPVCSREKSSSGPVCAGAWPTVVTVRQRPWGFRGATLLPTEHGTAAVLQYGYNGEQAPTDEQGWLGYAASLPDPTLHATLEHCQIISPIVKYAGLRNVLRCYHEMQMPLGVVAVGDSVAELNPIYAQGMTVAAVEALVLDTELRCALGSAAGAAWQAQQEGLRSLAQNFQRELIEAIAPVWGMCCAEDTRYPCARTEGVSMPPWYKAAYMNMLARAALRHQPTMELYLGVGYLELPVSTLYTPRVAWQVVKQATRDVMARLFSSLWSKVVLVQ